MGFKIAAVSAALIGLTFGAAVSKDADENVTSLSARDDAMKVDGLRIVGGSGLVIHPRPKKITKTVILTTTTIEHPSTVIRGTLKQIVGSETAFVTTLTTTVEEVPASSSVKVMPGRTGSPSVGSLVCTQDGKDVIDTCVAKFCGPNCPSEDEFCVKGCSKDDAHCRCKALTELKNCVKDCDLDTRHTSIAEKQRNFCEEPYVKQVRAGNPKLHPTATTTSTATWTEFRTLTIKQVYSTPLATEIIYNHGAGRVALWTGKAGHTHVPTIIEKTIDGKKVFETVNAKSGSPESDRQVSALMAAVAGAMGMIAAIL